MGGLNWGLIESARLQRQPFDHVAIGQALDADCARAVASEYPAIRSPGSFSLADAQPGPVLQSLISDLLSDRFRIAMERAFDLDLAGRPAVVTLRGQCSLKDGVIHTDSKSKILSLLIYLNPEWPRREAQLRLLKDKASLDTAPVEIPATMGSLVAFRRSDHSWHGHTPFAGERRVLQFNYLQSQRASVLGLVRHRLSALAKPRVAA